MVDNKKKREKVWTVDTLGKDQMDDPLLNVKKMKNMDMTQTINESLFRSDGDISRG